jgi:hypothetical protein
VMEMDMDMDVAMAARKQVERSGVHQTRGVGGWVKHVKVKAQ